MFILKTNEENQFIFAPNGKLKFLIETVDCEEEVVNVEFDAGYEMVELMDSYYQKDFKKLFKNTPFVNEGIVHCEWKGMTFDAENKDVHFNMDIPIQDIATVKLSFTGNSLKDKNARKIEAFRKILEYDPEGEEPCPY